MLELARRLRESAARGEWLRLSDEEVAFSDAPAHHQNAREVFGDDNLYVIAREVARSIGVENRFVRGGRGGGRDSGAAGR